VKRTVDEPENSTWNGPVTESQVPFAVSPDFGQSAQSPCVPFHSTSG
jgi:hypothetical protein